MKIEHDDEMETVVAEMALEMAESNPNSEIKWPICINLLGINALQKSHQTAAGMASIFAKRFCSNILTHLGHFISEFGLKHAVGGSITKVAAGWVAPHYLVALRGRLAALPDGPERFELLRLAVGDAVALQCGGHYGAKLQLEREWLELEHQKHRDAVAAKQQEVQQRRDPKLPLSDEDRKAIIDKADEILGLK